MILGVVSILAVTIPVSMRLLLFIFTLFVPLITIFWSDFLSSDNLIWYDMQVFIDPRKDVVTRWTEGKLWKMKQLWGLISLIATITSAGKGHVAHVCKI